MKHYIGLDISMKDTAICAVDETGKIIFKTTEKTDPKLIAKTIKEKVGFVEKIALESGSLSNWLVCELAPHFSPSL